MSYLVWEILKPILCHWVCYTFVFNLNFTSYAFTKLLKSVKMTVVKFYTAFLIFLKLTPMEDFCVVSVHWDSAFSVISAYLFNWSYSCCLLWLAYYCFICLLQITLFLWNASALEIEVMLFLYCWHQQTSWSLLSLRKALGPHWNLLQPNHLVILVTSTSTEGPLKSSIFSVSWCPYLHYFFHFHFSYPFHDQIWDHSYNSKCTPKILMAGSPPSGHHSASDSFAQLSSFLQFFICTDLTPRPQLLPFPLICHYSPVFNCHI